MGWAFGQAGVEVRGLGVEFEAGKGVRGGGGEVGLDERIRGQRRCELTRRRWRVDGVGVCTSWG